MKQQTEDSRKVRITCEVLDSEVHASRHIERDPALPHQARALPSYELVVYASSTSSMGCRLTASSLLGGERKDAKLVDPQVML